MYTTRYFPERYLTGVYWPPSASVVTGTAGDRLNPWFARWPRGRHPGTVEYDLIGSNIEVGAIVTKDGSDQVSEASSPNPSSILGIAAEDSGHVLFSGKLLVYEAKAPTVFASMGNRDPVAGDVGTEYGLAKDGDGIWVVNTSETVETRVKIMSVDVDRKLYFWKVLAANRQVN